jgi:hypothetical protein
MSIAENWIPIWDRIQKGSPQTPGMFEIPTSNLDRIDGLDAQFKPDQDYFQVIINEMYLTAGRKWFDLIAPAVFVVSDFTYDGKKLTTPVFIGPSKIKELNSEKQPHGVIYRDHGLGLYPYRGGGLTLYIALCEVGIGDAVPKQLLRIVESTAKALDFSPALSPYAKVASIVMEGFKELLDASGINPLISVRQSFGANLNIPFKPSFFVLLEDPKVDAQSLWVRDRHLMQGSDAQHLTPYRDRGYVLYSIVRPLQNERDDLKTLPFSASWERVRNYANGRTDNDHKNAKALMSELYQTIKTSPDLTEPQANELVDRYSKAMKAYIDEAIKIIKMKDKEVETTEAADKLDAIRDKALSILNL